jgi:polyhydroxybutyrate depolymerase
MVDAVSPSPFAFPTHRARIGVAVALLATNVASAARAACPSAPLPACRLAAKSSVRIVDDADDAKDRIVWKWSNGPATSQAELGDPTTTTSYTACLYAGSNLVAAFALPPGGSCGGHPCWSPSGKTGYRYKEAAATTVGIRALTLAGSTRTHTRIGLDGRGAALPDLALPLATPLTLQLSNDANTTCFETILAATDLKRNDTTELDGRQTVTATTPLPILPSSGCGGPVAPYAPGTSVASSLEYQNLSRTFRVYLPAGYAPTNDVAVPLVFLLHGGFGSGAQIETASRLLPVADAEGFIVVSPDGVAGPSGVRTWNAGGCCGYAVDQGIDDVGFIRALLDDLEGTLCVDRRRVYATGMSNGAMLTHRLACDLADRVRAVTSVSGSNMTETCAPARPIPVMEIHGTADMNVPFDGGFGCGAAGVAFVSVPKTMDIWATLDGCRDDTLPYLDEGDGSCTTRSRCSAASDVALCTIANGGHQWPGGEPPAVGGLPGCPFGYQSESFSASEQLWHFFATHPPR